MKRSPSRELERSMKANSSQQHLPGIPVVPKHSRRSLLSQKVPGIAYTGTVLWIFHSPEFYLHQFPFPKVGNNWKLVVPGIRNATVG